MTAILAINLAADGGGMLGGNPVVASGLGILTWLIGVPMVTVILLVWPRSHRLMLALMLFSTSIIIKPFYMEVFYQEYRGTDRGFGVTIPDLVLWGFFFFLLIRWSRKKYVWWPYNTGPWFALIGISIVSLIGSPVLYYGLFTLHKFVQAFVLYWVVVNVVREKKDVEAVIDSLAAAVIYQGALVLWYKYVTHTVVFRSYGTFPHSNTLAMYTNLILPILLALILSTKLGRRRTLFVGTAFLLGFVCVIFTKSRAALVLMLGALLLVGVVGVLPRLTPRKIKLVALGFTVLVAVGIVAVPQTIKRFEDAPVESGEGRVFFNNAARAMADDHPFGVGLNANAWMVRTEQYYWYVYPDKVDVPDPDAYRETAEGKERLAVVHNVYYLFAAEIGWFGMGVFLLFLWRFWWRNLRLWFQARDAYHKAILLGIAVGCLINHLQGMLEWVFRQTQVMYLFFALSGVVVAIGRRTRRGAADPESSRIVAPSVGPLDALPATAKAAHPPAAQMRPDGGPRRTTGK